VAGDYYDFLPVDGQHLRLLVADVSGHGIPAALIASMVKVAVGAQQDNTASPARVLAGMSRIFHGKLKRHFITAACLFADLESGRLVYASAGHPPPLFWRASAGRVEELRQDGQVLGRLARAEYREGTVPLEPGDRVLLFTDGIPEARDRNGEPFGDERLRAFLAAHAGLAAEPLATALLAEITRWTGHHGGFEDDLTVLVLSRLIEG
jgi:serine phosphatase RsbU (regulator of sigma subunit)